jgi:hypothetical protein
MKISLMLFVLMSLIIFEYSLPCLSVGADEGEGIFTESCTPCHRPKMRPLDNVHLTTEQWKETIDRMIDQGAELKKGKIPALLDYLSRTHGPIASSPSTTPLLK